MTECNSIEHNSYETHNVYPNFNAVPLSNQQQFRLKKINEIKYYFIAEIKERKLTSKRLSKFIASFDYFDNSIIVLYVTTGSISVASFATVIGTPVGIRSASFSLAFSISTGIVNIESKISEALINNKISHDIMIIACQLLIWKKNIEN